MLAHEIWRECSANPRSARELASQLKMLCEQDRLARAVSYMVAQGTLASLSGYGCGPLFTATAPDRTKENRD